MSDCLTRRQLVTALGLAPLAAPALAGCARRIGTDRSVAVGAPADGVVEAPLSALPELLREGGAVVLRPEGLAVARYGNYPYPVLLVAARAGAAVRYLAWNADCPHEGCEVAWVPQDQEIECPCHGSRFASDGRVLNPPAHENLTPLPVSVEGGLVRVQLLPGDGTFPAARSGAVTFNLADHPSLAQEGGTIEGRAEGYPHPLIVVRLGGALRSMSGLCPHASCTVVPQPDGFRCPCHGSTFTLSGGRILGPAERGLDQLPLEQPSPGVVRIVLPT